MEKNTKKVSLKKIAIIFWLTVIFVGIFCWYFWGGGLQQQTSKNLGSVYQQVASNAVKQYEIAKRSGSAVDACVQAGVVSAAYLQLQDETNYSQWKATQKSDCYLAGVPQ